jgi:cytochrome c553
LGKELYEKGCVACHGKSGEGDKEEFYPVIAGQHYMYLLRQMREIQAGRRHNVNQNMIKSTATFSDNNLQEISAYLASLEVLGAMCNPGLK